MAKVFAVALNTLRQTLRMKLAVVFIGLLVVLLPLLAWGGVGDGSPKGRLQTFISYGLSLTSLLLCVLTVFATAHTATSDLVHRQVFTVLCKPIRRWQFLLGKFVGVLLLDALLLTLAASFIYIAVGMMARSLPMSPAEAQAVQTQFFTARAGLRPPEPDVNEAAIDRRYQQLKESGELARFQEAGVPTQKIKTQLRNVAKLEQMAAAPGRDLVWEFHGIRRFDPNDLLFVRFKFEPAVNPLDLEVGSAWEIGDLRQYRSEAAATTPIVQVERRDPIRTAREFAVPARVIAADGYLGVHFINVPGNDTTIIFPLDDGLEIMYQAGTFLGNYLRAVLLIGLRLVFLGGISLCAASFLSFPVAILFCVVVFVMASVSGFITESFTYLDKDISWIYDLTVAGLVNLLPKFDKANPTSFLVGGRRIGTGLVIKALLVMGVLWGTISVGLGLWFFSRREVARVD